MKSYALCFGLSAAISGSALGQINATTLHNRFPVTHREEMQARQGISITVQYGVDMQACEIRIHPTNTSLLAKDPENFMLPDTLTEIINEIVPPNERGKAGARTTINAGCNAQTIQQYEAVSIIRSTHDCLPLQPAREAPAFLVFKRLGCVSVQKAKDPD